MPATKDKKRNTWTAQFYYTDWTGKKVKKCKRGFETKKEALDWEKHFLLEKSASLDAEARCEYLAGFCDSLCGIRQCALKKGVTTCGDCPDIDHCQAVATIISTNPEALKNLRG